MPERGARVPVPRLAERALRVIEYFTSPLQLDDYLELINPLWSTSELRGRIERVHHETDDAVSVYITPGFRWRGHAPGQYLRVGFDVDGKRQWRAYSLSSDAARPDGQITITVKRTADGVVSRWLHGPQASGSLVTLGEVEGEFLLPEATPDRLLFLTAGSGITPVMAMLRAMNRAGSLPDIVHVHSDRTEESAIFAGERAALAERHPGYRPIARVTSVGGRLEPAELDVLCPDWREREAYACGPGEMLDALRDHYRAADLGDHLHVESFEHVVLGDVTGEGGSVRFAISDLEAECDGATPILVAGESAGADLAYGCRMGICHTCVGRLAEGVVRDLRTGELTQAGPEIRICVTCPEGPITVEL